MKQPLNKALQEYYSGELNEAQLQKLGQVNNPRFKVPVQWALSGGIGFLAAAILLSFIFTMNKEPLSLRIAKEVSYSHNKQIPSEIMNGDYAFVGKSLDRLDFSIKESDKLGQVYVLIGGRYCSIQGHIAAQLKLKKQGSSIDLTLFQFKASDKFKLSGDAQIVQVNGVEVKIWQEGKIGFALAKTLASVD